MPTLMIPDGLGNLKPYAKGIGVNLYGSSSSYAGLKSPATGPGVVWTLPTADAAGYLKSDGSGTLSLPTTIPTSALTGTLGIGNGGTGQATANPAFNALSPLTTKGDVLGFSTVNARLAVGTDTQVLTADSTQTLGFKWATPSSASGANPSASVGLTAVNGAAGTFLRSDGAPALSQSITPTWTGAHIHTPSSGVAITVTTATSGTVGQIINGSASQSVDLLDLKNSSGTLMLGVSAAGNLTVAGTAALGATTVTGTVTVSGMIQSTSAVGFSIAPASGQAYSVWITSTPSRLYAGVEGDSNGSFWTGSTAHFCQIGNSNAYGVQFATNSIVRATIDANGNNILGSQAALATNATNGFVYIPSCAGTPTGVPTAFTGMVPLVFDTSNSKLYAYTGGAWKSTTLA